MGGCLSWPSINDGGIVSNNKPSAHIISLNGDLRQYPVPVTVSQVLQSEATPSTSSSSSASSSSCFVCNSDRLFFDDYIPSLNPEDELQAGQIYFVLPETKRHYKLSASDMAALAVKASVALQKSSGSSSSSSSSRRRKNKKARISPVILDVQHDQDQQYQADSYNHQQIQKDGLLLNKIAANDYQNYKASSGLGVSRSGSVRKLQRYSSRRAKMAVRSFRLRLSTIYEGSVHQFT